MAKRTRAAARALLVVTAAVALSRLPTSAASHAPVTFHDATPSQRALVVWALHRYARAGLVLAPLDVTFHTDPSGCQGNSGLYAAERLDVCVADASEYARKTVVHELAHAWCEANLSPADQRWFLRLRGLTTWGSLSQPWGLRGAEQAAEIITWGVGDRATPPLLEDDDPAQLRLAYEGLTGSTPLGP